MSLGKAEYYEFLRKMEFNPASYKEIANSLMQNGVIEMYHALVNERDILTLFTIPNHKLLHNTKTMCEAHFCCPTSTPLGSLGGTNIKAPHFWGTQDSWSYKSDHYL